MPVCTVPSAKAARRRSAYSHFVNGQRTPSIASTATTATAARWINRKVGRRTHRQPSRASDDNYSYTTHRERDVSEMKNQHGVGSN